MYAFQYCSPTRSAVLSGRNPIHVNVINADPNIRNLADPMSGFAGIPRNMTGLAAKMKAAGYATAGVGKFDAGMATPDHTPEGRGFDSWLGYFHHYVDGWRAGQMGACKTASESTGLVSEYMLDLGGNNASSASGGQAAPRWSPAPTAWQNPSGCWVQNMSSFPNYSAPAFPPNESDCTILDERLADHVVRRLEAHASPTSPPLFLYWAPHLVHAPLEMPRVWYENFSSIEFEPRRRHHAMVSYLDSLVGRVTNELKRTG